jgi:hypothetical protein
MGFFKYGSYMIPTYTTSLFFTKKKTVDHTMGIVLLEEGNESGTWVRVNKKFQTIDFNKNHPTWDHMKQVTNEYGDFIEIPTTWVRTETLQSGPYAGKRCWWISDQAEPGFHVSPSFKRQDGSIGPLQIAVNLSDTTASYHTLHNLKLANIRPYNIYDHHFLARLMLIEFGTSDVMRQTVQEVSWCGNQRIIYHGIHDPFGMLNQSCWIDGFTTENNTYNILAPDGSGSMLNLEIPCLDSVVYPINCLTGPDDLFIANQQNDLESYGSFASIQELYSNQAFCTSWGQNSYYGAFYLHGVNPTSKQYYRLVHL